jgi:large conductance mechanosensitive channel
MSLEIDPKEVAADAVKNSLGFVHEFKQFISRGNVVDLAVGVIIGGAFGQITTSLVNDVIMPPISWLMSGVDVKSWKDVIQPAVMGQDPKFPTDPTKLIAVKPEVAIAYGNFLQICLNFLIISFVIFLVIKAINSLKRSEAAKPVDPPVPSAQEKLLIEIRDLLAKRSE